MTEVPQQLVELAKAEKPTDYAAGLCLRYEDDIRKALNYEMISNPRGGALSLDSFLAAVKLDVASNERLQKAMFAAPGSFLKALLLAAQCKLLPGGTYDLFYLIPRWNKKLRCEEVTPMIGYKGMCEMAQRHPRVHKVEAFLVYEGEEFAFLPGEGKLIHRFGLDVDRSNDKLIAAYARVVITEPASTHPVLDDPVVWVMSRKEIDAVMHRSDAWKNAEDKGWKNSPWHTDYPMMARKTVLRAVLTKGSVPRDMGVGGAIQAEDLSDQIAQQRPNAALVKPTTQQALREGLGIDETDPQFDFVEEAIEAIKAAQTVEDLERLRSRWVGFQGEDVNIVARAYEERLQDME